MTATELAAPAELLDFAAAVGAEGPVCVTGGRTQWDVGGSPAPGTRELAAPDGVVAHQPQEMIVRVRAGTTLADLDAVVSGGGQMVPLDAVDEARATVGGVLSVGRSGRRRLRYGPARDTVLEVTFVSAQGRLVKAGGPVVKNVTGFDLCRLMVGSLGTLGLLAEVVLRCYPRPVAQRWLRSAEPGAADPFQVLNRLYRPSSVLWDGSSTWVLLEGHPDDVEAQAAVLGDAFAPVAGPPAPPGRHRVSVAPGRLGRLASSSDAGGGPGGGWLAQVGVGIVEAADPAAVASALGLAWPPAVSPRVAELHRELKQRFDPTGRLNPGRQVVDR